MNKQNAAMKRYVGYMTQIRTRTDVINKALHELGAGRAVTGYRECDVELIYLQLRHCLELMMLASLSAHYANGYSLSQKFYKKEYNATKLLRFIKTKNPNFYPRPVEGQDSVDLDGIRQTVEIRDGFLTQTDFCKLYDRICGKMLHAQRETKAQNDLAQKIKDAVYYRDRLVRLLNCHWIHLTEDTCYRVIMRDRDDGEVKINLMTKISNSKQFC